MKKSIITKWLLGAALLAAPACTDLDENVYDTIPSDEFGTTNRQINSIIAPVYTELKGIWPGDFFCLIEEASDMAITPTRVGGDWWDGGYHMEMKRRTWTVMNSLNKNGWNECMDGIATCNLVYNVIENNENMNEADKTITLAEIRGVRAYWVYMLIDNWGNAPLAKDFGQTELPKISSRAELFNFVVTELNDIKDKLADKSPAKYGRFTKGAAYTLLAKMYLNAEEWIGTPMWTETIAACDKVMSMDYNLEGEWKVNFQVSNEVSVEAIFSVPFSKSVGGNHLDNRTLHYKDPIALGFSKGTWNGISANPDYVKEFDPEDPRFEGSFLLGEMIDPSTGKVIVTDHGRPLIHTIDFNMMSTDKYDGIWGEVQQEEGARVNKWTYEAGANNTDMENDFHIFRLADVYLMKAEAIVRNGGDNAEATKLVNAIRERAYGDSDHNHASVDLEKIYKERRFELAWELHSRQDMIRFGKFNEPGYLLPETTPDYRKLFPIPYAAWQSNENLVQNPGYPAF
ncbi:MAG: RagB/SusD family nutrient uptake outer membrane protein [Bacteroidaceae bacterium]|nr:RagB/SusD family nutrient uptake outer membrane protein [Bacteroidaceae bacterium]